MGIGSSLWSNPWKRKRGQRRRDDAFDGEDQSPSSPRRYFTPAAHDELGSTTTDQAATLISPENGMICVQVEWLKG